MNCLIIEDEHRAAEHLRHQLQASGYGIDVLECISSVEGSVEWLSANRADLIFMDIQLGDGLSFEIFDHVQLTTPVIFTTSYNQYAIKAFEVNSLAYLLKPIKLTSLVQALDKYKLLFGQREPVAMNDQVLSLHNGFQKRLLINTGNTMLPLPVEKVAYFRVHNGRHLLVTTTDKQQYLIDNKLETLELRLDPARFFRVNRQYMVNVEAIHALHVAEHGKLKVDVLPDSKEEIIVSKEKASQFKSWLSQ